MRVPSTHILALVSLILAADPLLAQNYLTKEGQLAQPLKLLQLQGGFAGFTGVQYAIAPDGTWTSETVFQQKRKPKSNGKLSAKELANLAAILDKHDLAKLPAKSGKPPGANPHSITFEFGDKKAMLVGQTPPKRDAQNPNGSVESRFASIWEGVVGLLTASAPPKEK